MFGTFAFEHFVASKLFDIVILCVLKERAAWSCTATLCVARVVVQGLLLLDDS